MNNIITFRRVCIAVLIAIVAIVSAACTKENTDSNLQIYYSEVVNIGPSMSFASSTPTFYGPTPTNFAIASIKLNDEAITSDSFSIRSENGVVSISNTDALAVGVYKLSISCQGADGRGHIFSDVFVVRMVSATPEQIEVNTSEWLIDYAGVASDNSSVVVTPVGESVSISAYALVQPEGVEYFSISKAGVITLNASFKGDKLPGVYPLPIKITTPAGTQTYEGLLTAKITSPVLQVAYPMMGRMEYNMAFTSVVPTMKGSPEALAWAIKSITPTHADKFTIDPATGVISAAVGNELPVDTEFVFDLTATNTYGSTDFDAAYKVTVIAYIAPIDPATFGYEAAEAIQGGEFTAATKAGFVGDEATFALGTLPDNLVGQLSIDVANGTVSAKKGHSIPLGTYEIPVVATNPKGSAETKLTLSIIENPYYFTKIVYGNNLGLTPVESYANQFHAGSAAALAALDLTPTTDAKAGTEIVWSLKLKHQMTGTFIDASSGLITPSGFNNADGGNGGMMLVTATAGKGKVGETSVTIPVFFSFSLANSGITIRYKPFVFQVNPIKGGVSAIPDVSGVSDPSTFLLDYRRTFNYYNIGGHASHVDGIPSATSFLGKVWLGFFTSIGTPNKVNYGSKDPISYFVNKSRLPSALLYVDQTNKSVVVNPNKWLDDNGAANGVFFGQMTFVTNGVEGGINNGTKYFPLWIWFDEKF